ncbi:DUF3093 domain-containing protein [Serinibacter salmoneus]|uniref:DUF3093 family protein n=1 Tax=Serinibacter salmoneus TaxID=556530 RepID=A0A2A9CZW6_9MICO|nr:DUF3093 domain-containing protein [Serinibacter salmoneus]PFG19545.1 Protein of unknown function (DUF3093) [Serinibacter salmoneus]
MVREVITSEAHAERQWPSAAAWLLAPGAGITMALIVWPLAPGAALAVGLIVTVTCVLLLTRSAERVVVTDGGDPGLRVGPAFLDAWSIGEVTALDAEGTRLVLGPQADARAYLAHRGWISTAVKITVVDSEDPTPYWVVSTRRPEQLAQAVRAIRPPS